MINNKFLLIIPVLSLIGSGRYVWQVLKGNARPNRVTWILWALAPFIAFAAELHEGVGLASIVTFMSGFGPLLVVIASFIGSKAMWKLTKFDFVCGALSLLGLLLWAITRHGIVAISFSIMADALASLPTIAKSYKEPESESYLVFLLAMISCVITFLTIKVWSFANYGFPLYLFIVCTILVGLIKFRIGPRLKVAAQ